MDLSAEAQAQNKDLVADAQARTEKLQAEIVKERISCEPCTRRFGASCPRPNFSADSLNFLIRRN